MHLTTETNVNSDDLELDFDLEPYFCENPSENLSDSRMLEDSCFLDLDLNQDDDIDIDQDLEASESTSEDSESTSDVGEAPVVVGRIEDMVLSFLRQLATPGSSKRENESDENGSDGAKTPLTRADYKIEIPLIDRNRTDANCIPSKRVLRYPKKSPTGSARTFAQLFKVLDLAHEATLSGVPATKRDIYYRDVSLFGKQRVVDSLVDDLAATFELDRSDLNIRSSSKGVVCGSGLTITLLSGEMIQCKDAEGTLIPAGEDVESFSIDDDVAWVLVIEKEAVFQTLCRLQMCKNRSLPGSGIIITGKGYPDVATRHLVKSLADALPRRIPIMGLVDSDPYGLDILSVYKYGSQKLQHENDKLAAGRIRWLGIWASELESLNIGKDFLLPITTHDEKKALSILRRQNFPLPRKWKKELQYMLHSRRKAEIEIVTGGHDISRPTNDGDIIQERNVNKKDQGGDNPEPFLLQKTCNAHGLFIQYLTTKITNYVISASESRTEY